MSKIDDQSLQERTIMEDLSNSLSVLEIIRDQKRKKNLENKGLQKQENSKQNSFSQTNTIQKFFIGKLDEIQRFQELIYSPVTQKIKKTFISLLYKGVKYSLKCLKQPSQEQIQLKQVKLRQNQNSKQKFLLLDLDQTLVYTQKQIKTGLKNNDIAFSINYRPHIFQFLQQMEKYYQIYVFTAGTRQYAQGIIKKLNERKKIIKDFLCREDCFQTKKGNFIKDLRIIKNRELKDLVIVDNKIQSFGFQLSNGIPILQFKGASDDIQLLKLKELLIKLSGVYDVRRFLADKLKLRQLGSIPKQKMRSYISNSDDHI